MLNHAQQIMGHTQYLDGRTLRDKNLINLLHLHVLRNFLSLAPVSSLRLLTSCEEITQDLTSLPGSTCNTPVCASTQRKRRCPARCQHGTLSFKPFLSTELFGTRVGCCHCNQRLRVYTIKNDGCHGKNGANGPSR